MSLPPTDAERFEVLYRAHYAAVARYVRRRIDADGADEVIAETFAVAWRRLHDVPDDTLPWLYAVARNVLFSEHRATRSRRATAASVAALAGYGRDPADVTAERDHVLMAFATLSERDREALRLTAWEGLDHRRAANACGISRVAFSMRLSRARRRLEAALGDLDGRISSPPSSTTAKEKVR